MGCLESIQSRIIDIDRVRPVPSDLMIDTRIVVDRPLNTFTVSVRAKKEKQSIFAFLKNSFGNLPLNQIESVFGFVEKSTLYGGRKFVARQISDKDAALLAQAGIGVRIPMTNHYASRKEFELNKKLLGKYHNKRNSIICTNDELAIWIRDEYPDYDLEASVIKNINNPKKLEEALEIYHTVVLPMSSNQDVDFLESIQDKSRIRLFANAGCAFNCPSKICYQSVSKINKPGGEEYEFRCSQPIKEREMKGMLNFDLERLAEMGFHKYKLLQSRPGNLTGY